MSQILTFLGKGGTGRSTLAVAAARAAAQQGRRVLLVGHQAGPGLEMLLGGIPLSGEPVTIAANLSVVQLRTTQLLEQFWTAAKELEARYVRTPFFREIYGQELG
ncbi:ArsA-related P-loop ATPase, partial [Synechococcus sp. R6-6]|uniref:ArsA-related P-loop ATPase n=2 Tax=Synechococcus TaxID=1129 RepID=UPI0039C1B6A6